MFGSVSILTRLSTQVAHQHAPSLGTFCTKFEEKPIYLAQVSRHYILPTKLNRWPIQLGTKCLARTPGWCLGQFLFLLSLLHKLHTNIPHVWRGYQSNLKWNPCTWPTLADISKVQRVTDSVGHQMSSAMAWCIRMISGHILVQSILSQLSQLLMYSCTSTLPKPGEVSDQISRETHLPGPSYKTWQSLTKFTWWTIQLERKMTSLGCCIRMIWSHFGSVSILTRLSTQVTHKYPPSLGTFCIKFEENPVYESWDSTVFLTSEVFTKSEALAG